jgi:hypothetical protein
MIPTLDSLTDYSRLSVSHDEETLNSLIETARDLADQIRNLANLTATRKDTDLDPKFAGQLKLLTKTLGLVTIGAIRAGEAVVIGTDTVSEGREKGGRGKREKGGRREREGREKRGRREEEGREKGGRRGKGKWEKMTKGFVPGVFLKFRISVPVFFSSSNFSSPPRWAMKASTKPTNNCLAPSATSLLKSSSSILP